MSIYHYRAFGLCFGSDRALPELPACSTAQTDVLIKTGSVPEELQDAEKKTVRFQIAVNDFILKVDGIARYRVQQGNKITIEPLSGAEESDVRLFLYGSAFAALFHQRGLMPLHANSVFNDRGAIAFAGNSGAGKSTLSFSLIETGDFRLVSDDITILKQNESGIFVQPGMPHLKLWADVLESSQKDLSGLQNIRREIQKFRYPVENRFSDQPVELRAMYFLSPAHQDDIRIVPVSGTEKFNLLQNNIFRNQFVFGRQMQETYFRITTAVLQKVPVYRVTRPRQGGNASLLRDKILESLR